MKKKKKEITNSLLGWEKEKVTLRKDNQMGLEKKKKDNILSLFDFVRNIQINEMEEISERGKKRNFMERERERAKR